MNNMIENIETIIANLDSKYKKTKATTNECSADCWVRFFINEEDGTITYEDECTGSSGFKTLQEAIEDCISGLKESAYNWACDTCEVDYNSLQIGWRGFETYEDEWEYGSIGEITFTIAMNRCEEEFDDEE